jgi:hypothetical protein
VNQAIIEHIMVGLKVSIWGVQHNDCCLAEPSAVDTVSPKCRQMKIIIFATRT